ncbi:MAG: hypothetical protein OXU79_17485 [Gemmatimonadota bacterium]|nr:hypothetical protein [Gemmatimonadota bacterium]
MINPLRGIVGIAAFTLTAFLFHATVGASANDGGATSHAISVDANVDDTVSIPDFDGDGTIGFGDFLKFAAKFGLGQSDDGYDPLFDLNGDGAIGFTDFLILAENFGKAAASSGTGGSQGDGGTGGTDRWLTIQSFEVSDNSLTVGQTFTLVTTVRNPGSDARGASLDFFRSTDATIDSTDAFIYNEAFAVGQLEASATQTVSLDWLAPPYGGTYYYGVCVFPWHNSFGNCSAGVRVTVEGSMGGLRI